MALTTAHPAIRWAVPGAVVAVALGAAAFTAVSANATATLPRAPPRNYWSMC